MLGVGGVIIKNKLAVLKRKLLVYGVILVKNEHFNLLNVVVPSSIQNKRALVDIVRQLSYRSGELNLGAVNVEKVLWSAWLASPGYKDGPSSVPTSNHVFYVQVNDIN